MTYEHSPRFKYSPTSPNFTSQEQHPLYNILISPPPPRWKCAYSSLSSNTSPKRATALLFLSNDIRKPPMNNRKIVSELYISGISQKYWKGIFSKCAHVLKSLSFKHPAILEQKQTCNSGVKWWSSLSTCLITDVHGCFLIHIEIWEFIAH